MCWPGSVALMEISQAWKVRRPCDLFCFSPLSQVLCKSEYSYAWVSVLHTLFSLCLSCQFFVFGIFFCFTFSIKLCVPSWSSTLPCWYGTRLMKYPLTSLWRLNWICKDCLFHCMLGCAWVDFVSITLRRANLSKRKFSWTRTSFIWSTTFPGICHSKTRLMLAG